MTSPSLPALPVVRSIRWRLTLWYALALGLSLALFAAGSLVVLTRGLHARADRSLEDARGFFTTELGVEYHELGTVRAAVAATLSDTKFRDTWAWVFDSTGTEVAPPNGRHTVWPNLVEPPEISVLARRLAKTSGVGPVHESYDDDNGGYRAAGGAVHLSGRRYAVVTIQARHDLRDTLEQVTLGYVLAVPFALILAMAGGYVLAGRALAPMAAMTRRTREISAANLHQRLPIANPNDEVGQLAGVVNDLLSRLQAAFDQQRRFVADASHELRTPVATVCAEADVTLAHEPRAEAEYRDSLGVVRDAGRRLSRIVDDLFLIARADAGHLPVARAPLYLDELVTDVGRSMRAVAGTRRIHIESRVAGEVATVGDAALIERLLLNVLDNAVKHSHPDTTVAMALTRAGDQHVVRVTNQGDAIPPEAREKIFDRFFRLDAARSRHDASTTSGAGLGLSIARWIAEAHGGTLECVRSDAAVTEFAFTLPASNS